jgi:putative peptide zinc metalloprotease protein
LTKICAGNESSLARAEEKLDSLLVIAAGARRAQAGARAGPAGALREEGRTARLHGLSGPPRLLRVVVTQDDIALVRDRRAAAEVKITDRLEADLVGARPCARCPAATTSLPSKALALEGGGLHGTDPRDPNGLKSLQRLFQFDLELPPEVGAVHIGTRAFVRFHHHAEPLATQWGRRLRQLFLSRFNV